jgi:hypothetical protein
VGVRACLDGLIYPIFSKFSEKVEYLLNNAGIFWDLYQSHLGVETKRRQEFVEEN